MAPSAGELTARAQDIVRAARAILEESGPDALSMRAIAERLGIKAPSLYKHVPDKEALETALVTEAFTEIAAAFEAAAVADDPLAAVARAYRRWGVAHPHLYRLVNDRPLPRDRLPAGLEDRAGAVVVAAAGGDADVGRAAFAFAHGMVTLEINGRFPPSADLDAAWRRGIDAFRPREARRPRRP